MMRNGLLRYFLLVSLLFLFAFNANSANRFAVASGAWNASIWSTTAGGSPTASVPGSGDQVTINAGVTVNITAAANAATLTVSGTLNFNSGFDLTIANGGNVSVLSGGAMIFDANGQLLGGGATGTTGVAVKINSGATLVTANATGFMAGVNNTVLTGSIAINRGARIGPVYNTGVDYVYNSASAQNIGTGPTTMGDLTISNTGVVSASGNFTVAGILTIGNNATLSLLTRTLTLSGGGTTLAMSSTGTLSPGTSTVVYSGTTAQDITGTTYNNLTFSGAGTKTFPAGSDASIAGNWVTGTANITMSGDANVSVTGAISGSAQITMGSGFLTVGGTTTGAFGNSGTFNAGTGTVIYNRSGAQTLKLATYNNLTLSGTGTNVKTISGAITVNGTLTMEGTATVATTTPGYGAAAALVYSSTSARNTGLEWPAQMTPTGGITIGSTGAVSLNANKLLQAGVPLIINSGATLTTGNFDLVLRDDLVNNGTWTTSTGDVTVNGTAAQAIGTFSTTGAFISTKTGGTATLTGDIIAGTMTINGSNGTVNLGAGRTHEVVGAVTLTAGTLNGGTSVLKVGGNWTGMGTVFTATGGTVNFYRAAQTLSASGAKTFYNLTFSGGGNKTTSAGTTVVNGVLSLEDIAAPAGTFPTYGTNATLRYNTSTGRTAGNEWLATFTASGGVVIDNTGTIAIGANKAFGVNAPFTIASGATFNAGAFDMNFGNDFINNGGTWTTNSGDVTLSLNGTQSIAGFTTTGLFSMLKNGGTATLQGNVSSNGFTLNGAGGTLDLGAGLTHTFNGTYTNTAGTVNGNTSTMNLAADVASSGGTFNPQTGTVNFTGNVPQAVPPVTWYNVGFSGTGLKVMVGEGGASNVMTIEPGATVDMGAFTFTLSGPNDPLVINGNGTLVPSTSVIGFTNAGAVNIPPINYYSLYGSLAGGTRTFSSSGTYGIAGTFTPGPATYNVTGSTVDFNGAGDQPIPAFTFHRLVVSNNGIKRIQPSVVVACQSIDINDNASVEVHTDALAKLNITGP